MIAKAKVISHGANAIRYSVDKDKAEIVKTNLLPDDISPTAMWARMLALQKKFEDKLNRYHPLKRNMIRIEVSPTSEETQGWTMEEWQRLADDFIREFDAVDLSAKSKRKSAKATNLKDSQYVVALHHDSKSGIMHLHIDANRIDMRGNVNDAHYIYERAMAAAAKVGQQRGWKDAQEVSRQNKEAITNDCLSVLAKMPYFDWGLYTKCLTQMGYDVKLQSDSKGQVRGYAIKRGNSIYKSSELGKGRCLMPSKIEGTWAKSELKKAVTSLQEAKDNLNKATDKADAATKAIDSFIVKVRDIKFKAKVDDADIEKLTDDRKKLIGDESKLLEDHRKENKDILTRHFYDMSNMMSRNEGVWLSNGWVKALLWIFLPCFLYTVISIVYFVASCIDK